MRARTRHLASDSSAADVSIAANSEKSSSPQSATIRYYADACCPALPMMAIWMLITGNFVLHEVLRPEPQSFAARVAGYTILALTVCAYFQCVCTHPGSPPVEWRTAALEQRARCTLHHSTSEPVPARGRYYRRWGEVLLAFDHHCWWLGRPVAMRNRKFFVQFLLWSTTLSAFGLALSAADLRKAVPYYGLASKDSTFGAMWYLPIGGPMQAAMLAIAISHMEANEITRLVGLYVLSAIDLVATLLLGLFALYHVRMVLRNETSLGALGEESQYDVGAAANWRQVFGRRRVLWALPLWLDDAPAGCDGPMDGIHWPSNSPSQGTRDG